MNRTLSTLFLLAGVALMAGAIAATLLARPASATLAAAVDGAAADEASSDETDDEPALARGVMLRFTQATPDGRAAWDARVSRMVALHVPRGQSPTALLAGGPRFTAEFTGFINVGLRSRVYFSLAGRGKATLTVDGEVVLGAEADDLSTVPQSDRIRLGKGPNAFKLVYQPPADGDAEVRLYWESREFPREPVPPDQLSHDPTNVELRQAMQVRRGRRLFADMRCVRCHKDDALLADSDKHMPELAQDAPSLADAGARLNAAWVAHWLQSPRAFRHDATMPALLKEDAKTAAANDAKNAATKGDSIVQHVTPSAEAWDIAAYLDTLGEKPPTPNPPADKVIKAGGDLFAKLGCIGCHTLPGHSDAKTVDDRVPLKHVASKWNPVALRSFLLDPPAHYKWIRMPHFGLSNDEAEALAAFVWTRSSRGLKEPLPQPRTKPDAARGRQLVQSLGCMSCHTVSDALKNEHAAPPLAELAKTNWLRGCVTESPNAAARGTAPNYSFTKEQVEALRAFAGAGLHSLKRVSPTEFAQRQVDALRCTACHDRDGDNSVWSKHEGEVASLLLEPIAPKTKPGEDYDEDYGGTDEVAPDGTTKEAQIDQTRPNLTWVGGKLKPGLMERLIAGKLPYKSRPWLHARMPAFPARADLLAKGMAAQHGFGPVAPPEPKPDADLVAIGARLVGKNNGFSCVLCHGVGEKPAENVFEAQGVNFARGTDRLREEYFHRWMLKPNRIQANTRMPQFASEDGTTPFFDVLDGDARKQFQAIWHYLIDLRNREAGKQEK